MQGDRAREGRADLLPGGRSASQTSGPSQSSGPSQPPTQLSAGAGAGAGLVVVGEADEASEVVVAVRTHVPGVTHGSPSTPGRTGGGPPPDPPTGGGPEPETKVPPGRPPGVAVAPGRPRGGRPAPSCRAVYPVPSDRCAAAAREEGRRSSHVGHTGSGRTCTWMPGWISVHSPSGLPLGATGRIRSCEACGRRYGKAASTSVAAMPTPCHEETSPWTTPTRQDAAEGFKPPYMAFQTLRGCAENLASHPHPGSGPVVTPIRPGGGRNDAPDGSLTRPSAVGPTIGTSSSMAGVDPSRRRSPHARRGRLPSGPARRHDGSLTGELDHTNAADITDAVNCAVTAGALDRRGSSLRGNDPAPSRCPPSRGQSR